MRDLLTAAEVAERLSVPTSWVYAETRAGRIPHIRLGPRYRRYRADAIERWVLELEHGPAPYRTHSPAVQHTTQRSKNGRPERAE
jgi:excisionase family DNA binding protein